MVGLDNVIGNVIYRRVKTVNGYMPQKMNVVSTNDTSTVEAVSEDGDRQTFLACNVNSSFFTRLALCQEACDMVNPKQKLFKRIFKY